MHIPNRLPVGMDVSKEHLDFALLAPDGTPLEVHHPFPNTVLGVQAAQAWLLQVVQEQAFEGIDLAAEATSYYWLPAFIQWAQDPALAAQDYQSYLFNPRWVRWYKQSLSPDHKDDMTDPQYIADRLRTRKPDHAWAYDPHWLSLRLLTRFHAHLSKSLVREKNLFQLYLFLAYTTYAQRKPFANLLTPTSQSLLRHPDQLAQLSQGSLQDAREYLSELSGHHLPQPDQNAAALRQILQESFPLPAELAPTVHALLDQLLTVINHLQDSLHQVDAQIAHHLQQDAYPEVAWLDSIPGVGPVLAAGLAAEIAGLERFQQVPKWDQHRNAYRPRQIKEVEDAVGKLAGLWWPKNASGKFEAEERHLSKEGNAYLRYYILEAADSMRRCLPSYAQYYQIKYDQATKHKHKRALVLLGRKALGLFVSLLTHHEIYRAQEAA